MKYLRKILFTLNCKCSDKIINKYGVYAFVYFAW